MIDYGYIRILLSFITAIIFGYLTLKTKKTKYLIMEIYAVYNALIRYIMVAQNIVIYSEEMFMIAAILFLAVAISFLIEHLNAVKKLEIQKESLIAEIEDYERVE